MLFTPAQAHVEKLEVSEQNPAIITFVQGQLTSPSQIVMIEPGESNYDRERREAKERENALKSRYSLSKSHSDDLKVVNDDTTHNCVKYAQEKYGLTSQGVRFARLYKTDSDTPVVGKFVKTNEGSVGHIAVVVATSSGKITLEEANYEPGKITQRTLAIDDPRIVGYITK